MVLVPYWYFYLMLIFALLLLLYAYFRQAAMKNKEKQLLEQGLVKERPDYFLQQEHCYYSSNISTIDEIISNLDLDFLKENTPTSLWENLTPILIKNNKIYYRRKLIKSIVEGETEYEWFIIEFSQQESEKNFVYTLNILEYPIECFGQAFISDKAEIRWHYNLFVTYLETVMKSLDGSIEVSSRLKTFG